jgi:hypothetical protein
MKNWKPKPALRSVEVAGQPVAELDVARLIATLPQSQLEQLVAQYSNGRVLRPFRTGFEVEQL